jgi:phosphatidylglycerophosphate synthase
MTLIPPVILLSLSVALGLYLGYQFLRHRRNRPVLIALHILPGLGALEVIAMLLRGAPDGSVVQGTALGKAAALLLIVAIIIGLLTPMLARDRPRAVATTSLSAHALLAGTAFVLLVAWVASA